MMLSLATIMRPCRVRTNGLTLGLYRNKTNSVTSLSVSWKYTQ